MLMVHRTSVTCGECLEAETVEVTVVVATVEAVVVQLVASVAVASVVVLAVADHSNTELKLFFEPQREQTSTDIFAVSICSLCGFYMLLKNKTY